MCGGCINIGMLGKDWALCRIGQRDLEIESNSRTNSSLDILATSTTPLSDSHPGSTMHLPMFPDIHWGGSLLGLVINQACQFLPTLRVEEVGEHRYPWFKPSRNLCYSSQGFISQASSEQLWLASLQPCFPQNGHQRLYLTIKITHALPKVTNNKCIHQTEKACLHLTSDNVD